MPLQLSLEPRAYGLHLVELLQKFLIFSEKQGNMRKIQSGNAVGLLIVGAGVVGLKVIVGGEFGLEMIHIGHYVCINIIIKVIWCVGYYIALFTEG